MKTKLADRTDTKLLIDPYYFFILSSPGWSFFLNDRWGWPLAGPNPAWQIQVNLLQSQRQVAKQEKFLHPHLGQRMFRLEQRSKQPSPWNVLRSQRRPWFLKQADKNRDLMQEHTKEISCMLSQVAQDGKQPVTWSLTCLTCQSSSIQARGTGNKLKNLWENSSSIGLGAHGSSERSIFAYPHRSHRLIPLLHSFHPPGRMSPVCVSERVATQQWASLMYALQDTRREVAVDCSNHAVNCRHPS